LLKLAEERLKAKEIFYIHQNCIKHWFDKKYAGTKNFNVGDSVLKWYKSHEEKGKHAKFQSLWIGPYTIEEKLGHNNFKLKSLDGRTDPIFVNA